MASLAVKGLTNCTRPISHHITPLVINALRATQTDRQTHTHTHTHTHTQKNNPHIVVNGFKHTGIHQAFGMLCDNIDLLTYSDDSFEYYDDESLDEYELPDSASAPFLVHHVYTETESEALVVEIASSDEQ